MVESSNGDEQSCKMCDKRECPRPPSQSACLPALPSLVDNYAIRRLQEQFITQVAAQVLFEEGAKHMQQEMEEIGGCNQPESPSNTL